MNSAVVTAVGALAGAALLTYIVRHLALAGGMLDTPNERSAHIRATPRGGGAAIVIATTVGLLALYWLGSIERPLAIAFGVGGLAAAAIGFVDDRRSVRPGVRFLVHAAAALWAVVWLGGLPQLRIANHLVSLGIGGDLLAAAAIVWTLNLFNFMDGIDGIAASEAVFVAGGAALLGALAGHSPSVAPLALVLAAASCGFLLWNWPPARIFLGDVGSGYLGYALAVLALAATRADASAVWVWLILGGVFFVDATATLVRRALRGERVYTAHCSHAYQWLARRWGSHGKVTLAVLAVNLLWLFPCAVFASRRPDYAAAAVVVAFAPLILTAVVVSGRRELNERAES